MIYVMFIPKGNKSVNDDDNFHLYTTFGITIDISLVYDITYSHETITKHLVTQNNSTASTQSLAIDLVIKERQEKL